MHEYEVIIGGLPHVVLLDDESAAARGLLRKAAAAPANKEREPMANKARDAQHR